MTGRQSEVGFSDNKTLYRQYRLKSAQEFRIYCEKEQISEGVIKLLEHPLEHMGAPAMIYVPDQSLSIESQQIQQYLQQIFTLSHELDMLRVMGEKEWRKKIKGNLDAAQIPNDQRRVNDFQTLVSSLLIAMGDRCCLDSCLQEQKKFRPPFAAHSTKVTQCQNTINSIKNKVKTQQTPGAEEMPQSPPQPEKPTTAVKVRDTAGLLAGCLTIIGGTTAAPMTALLASKKWSLLEEHVEEFKLAAEIYGGVIGALLVIAFIAHICASRQVTSPSEQPAAPSNGNGVHFFSQVPVNDTPKVNHIPKKDNSAGGPTRF